MNVQTSARRDVSPPPSRLWTERNFNTVIATAVLLVVTIPVGIANIYLGFVLGESPCILCGLERFGMLLVGAIGLLILRYGPHYKYIATLLIAAFFFLYTTLRHWAPHIPEDLGQGFGGAMFNVHTYTWATLIYWVIIAAVAVGMIFVGREPRLLRELAGHERPVKRLSAYSKGVGVVVLALAVSNAFQFLVTNGPPPYAGMSDPPRFTLDVRKAAAHWTTDVYSRLAKPSLHGFTAPTPHLPGDDAGAAGLPIEPADGPAQHRQPDLTVAKRTEIGFPVSGSAGGTAAGIAYDEANRVFGLVSTDAGLYYVRDDFHTVVSSAALDQVNGNDIAHTVDATFLGPGKLLAMSANKTVYGTKRVPPGEVNGDEAWAEFRRSTGDLQGLFDLKERPRLFTARAKNAYALSIAADPATTSYYVVSVPHPGNSKIVISQFGSDHKLSREGVLGVADQVGLRPGADVADFYPVGADFRDGTLYLLSKAYNSLLLVDANTLRVTAVHGLPQIGDFSDVAVTPGRRLRPLPRGRQGCRVRAEPASVRTSLER